MIYVILISNFILGSKVTAVLLNGWILPIGEVTSERVGAQTEMLACCRTALSPLGVVVNIFQNNKLAYSSNAIIKLFLKINFVW